MTRPHTLDLDFVAAPRAMRLGRGVLALGVAGVLAGAIVVADAWHTRRTERHTLSQIAMISVPKAPRVAVDPAMLRAAGSVTRELQLPWGQLLASLETIASRDVAVLSIEPTASQQTLRITADARHAEAMLDYVAQLKQQSLAQVMLTSHQLQPQAPGAPIRFQLQARWGDATQDVPLPPSLAANAAAPTAVATDKDKP